jgi:putative membrane protein
MNKTTLAFAAAATAALLAGVAPSVRGADPTAARTQAASRAVSDTDRTFMTKAAGAGLYEVEVAKIAAQKAESADVKQFADMLVQHHTAANDELKALAATKSVELPKDVPADKKNKMAMLEKNSGASFDRAFIKEVGVSDHQTDIKLFEMASRSAKDAEVKTFATKTLPTLKQHLSAAQKLAGSKGK